MVKTDLVSEFLQDWVLCKHLPGQHCQSLGSLSDTQGVLIQHINRWDKKTRPGNVIGVKVTVRDGTEQVIVFSR